MKLELKKLLLIVFFKTLSLASYAAAKIIIDDIVTGGAPSYTYCSPSSTFTANSTTLTGASCNSGFEKKYLIQYAKINGVTHKLQIIGKCDEWRIGRNPWEEIESNGTVFTIKHNGVAVASFNIIPNGDNINVNNVNNSTMSIEVSTCQVEVILKAKVFLENGQIINNQWLMNDDLNTSGLIPLTDPYKTSAFIGNFTPHNCPLLATTTAATLSAAAGNNTIVDWVFIMIVPENVNLSVVTRAALLQRDGDIVDVDGSSPIKFNCEVGKYKVTVKHRNHIQLQTSDYLILNNIDDVIDFTNNSLSLDGNNPTKLLSTNLYGMYGGDANNDNLVDDNDYNIWENQNGNFNDYFLNGDFNMDGSVDAFDSIVWQQNKN